MVRTQLYLPEGTHSRLKQAARQQGKAMAELVRELLERTLSTPANDPLPAWRRKYAHKFRGWDSTKAIRKARDTRWNLS